MVENSDEEMDERQFKINTLEIGSIFLDNPDGNHMSWIELESTLNSLYNENKQLQKTIERKDTLLKIRTEDIKARVQSFDDFIDYMDTFMYKSDVDPNDVKEEIIHILQNWEIRPKRGKND